MCARVWLILELITARNFIVRFKGMLLSVREPQGFLNCIWLCGIWLEFLKIYTQWWTIAVLRSVIQQPLPLSSGTAVSHEHTYSICRTSARFWYSQPYDFDTPWCATPYGSSQLETTSNSNANESVITTIAKISKSGVSQTFKNGPSKEYARYYTICILLYSGSAPTE